MQTDEALEGDNYGLFWFESHNQLFLDIDSACFQNPPQFQVVHHTNNTSPTLLIRSQYITTVYIIPQPLNNFNFYYCIIIHSYPIL